MLRPLRGGRGTSWGHGCSRAVKIETDARLPWGRMWGFFESWVWASPDTSRALHLAGKKFLCFWHARVWGHTQPAGKNKSCRDSDREMLLAGLKERGAGESLQSALFVFSPAWLKIPKPTIRNKPHPQLLSGINREREENLVLCLWRSCPSARQGGNLSGCPFSTQVDKHRPGEGGECNLLFQRKARSRTGVKVLMPGQREPGSAHFHTPPLVALMKKWRKIRYFYIVLSRRSLFA